MSVRVHITRPNLVSVWSGFIGDVEADLGTYVGDGAEDPETPVLVIQDIGNQEAWVIVGLKASPVAVSTLHLALTGKITEGGTS